MIWNTDPFIPATRREDVTAAARRDAERLREHRIEQQAKRVARDQRRRADAPSQGRRRPVLCVETGDRFRSLTEAAARVGVKQPQNIWRAIKNRKSGATCRGYTWRYAGRAR